MGGRGGRAELVIVGFGRLGGALALGLRARGWPVAVFPRSDASVRRAVELGLVLAEAIEVPESTRAAYHAGAVTAAGGAVALLSSAVHAFAAAGISEKVAARSLIALQRSALRGGAARPRRLTGLKAYGERALAPPPSDRAASARPSAFPCFRRNPNPP